MRRSLRAGLVVILAMPMLADSALPRARAQNAIPSASQAASAGVRMVRLSAVHGHVELDRSTERGFEPGFTNLPVVQGNRLRTPGFGWAEVELEDGGTARITPDSLLEFKTLARSLDGQLHTGFVFYQGTLYVSRLKGDRSNLQVVGGGRTILLPPGSHVRLDVDQAGAELVVFQGTARVEDEHGVMTAVGRGRTLQFGASAGVSLVKSKGRQPGPYDRWDAAAVALHEAVEEEKSRTTVSGSRRNGVDAFPGGLPLPGTVASTSLAAGLGNAAGIPPMAPRPGTHP